nr:immunoglobulin light chain junction region [Macaca mulatta]MOW70798.1 immunoglobulin light chain junction region [Macaca mulatta]
DFYCQVWDTRHHPVF